VVGLGLREKSLAPGSRTGDDNGYIVSFLEALFSFWHVSLISRLVDVGAVAPSNWWMCGLEIQGGQMLHGVEQVLAWLG
jgi:hypothetical protein